MMPDGQDLSGGKISGPDGDGQPSADELFGTRPAATPAEIRHAMLSRMGEDAPLPQSRPGYPGIHELAEDLGLA